MGAPAVGLILYPVLGFRGCRSLPLHVARIIGAATLQGHDVIHNVHVAQAAFEWPPAEPERALLVAADCPARAELG